MEAVLDVRHIEKRYRGGKGLFDVSFQIGEGEIYGLLGPNGAGKTTLLKSIVGLKRPASGEVRLFGHSVQREFERAMSGVGCVLEAGVTYEHLTGRQNLEQAARLYSGIGQAEIEETLKLVGLAEHAGGTVRNYSSGMKQRLALGSALLSKPRLFILDEPTSNMDVEGILDFQAMVARLSREWGITFMISSHSIRDMEAMCSRIGILHNGRLIRECGVDEIREAGTDLVQYYTGLVEQARKEESR